MVTPQSIEIIDVSFETMIGVVQKRPDPLARVITRPVNDLKGVAYKPMLVSGSFIESCHSL